MAASGSADGGDGVDVAVVGGGPAGGTAAIYTARYGLETVVFDRGRSSLRQCAHLENFPGFPAGIDVETFLALLDDQITEAGGTVVDETVERVTRGEGNEPFVVHPTRGEPVRAHRVVAATRYDADYLQPVAAAALFEADATTGSTLDRSTIERDGATPVEGLFVASPSEAADRQAILAAGRGARVGLAVVEAHRRETDLPAPLARHWDWVRRETTLEDEWRDRDTWRDSFDERRPADHELARDAWTSLREAEIDRQLATYLPDEDVKRRRERAQRRLLDHVDDELIQERARALDAESPEEIE